jgi:hypothetical protein
MPVGLFLLGERMTKKRSPADHIPHGEGEKQMFCAVILQAWEDYFTPLPESASGSWGNSHQFCDWRNAKREAHSFFSSTTGQWAQSRVDVCGAAGIDPDALRDRFLMKEAEAA